MDKIKILKIPNANIQIQYELHLDYELAIS